MPDVSGAVKILSMAKFIYDKFEEVEETIRDIAPPIVYKIRGDIKNEFHRNLLEHQQAWFAAPKDLNDPHDIRTPLRFNINELDDPKFLQKIKDSFIQTHPSIAVGERELNVIAENKLEEIRADPENYFREGYDRVKESDIYDRVGLFSCTIDPLNETMWAHYGNNHKGFAVGFHTVELARSIQCSIGSVNYSDEVPLHSFLVEPSSSDSDRFFLKSKKWDYEKEFRLYTVSDEPLSSRIRVFSKDSVAEVVIGYDFEENEIGDLINMINAVYGPRVEVYRLKVSSAGYGFDKIRVK